MVVVLSALADTMIKNTVTIGHFFVVHWQHIEIGDFERVIERVRAAHRASGRRVIYVAVQDDDYRDPDKDVKEDMRRKFPELMEHVETDYVVITATGVRGTLQRSFLRALLTMGRLSNVPAVDRVVVLDEVEQVLARESKNLPVPAAEIMRRLRELGIVGGASRTAAV